MPWVKFKCDDCEYLHNLGPNYVPYGDTWVNEGDVYECSLGYDAITGDCPEETFRAVDHFSLMHGYQRARDAGVD